MKNLKNLKKLSGHYEFVLLGYNMASLQMAFELAKNKKSFCVLDCRHTGHSLFKFIPELGKNLYTSLPFNTGLTGEFSSRERELLGPCQVKSHSTLSFARGEFHEFSGFGDRKVEAAILSYYQTYCRNQELKTEKSPEDFRDEVVPLLGDHLFLDQEITDIHASDREIKKLVFNGQTEVSGQFFYFFDKLPFLFKKLEPQLKKTARQFAGIKWYSSVNLMIHHRQKPRESEPDRSYLLMGSKSQVCLGMFSQIRGELISRWQSFFPSEQTASPEETGRILRELKRQVQRAFPLPNPKEQPNGEFVSLQDPSFADLSKTRLQNGKSGDFNNLFVYSPCLCPSVGWLHDRLVGHGACPVKSFEKKVDPKKVDPMMEVADLPTS